MIYHPFIAKNITWANLILSLIKLQEALRELFCCYLAHRSCSHWGKFDGLEQERHNSSSLAMELSLSCTEPSILFLNSLSSSSISIKTHCFWIHHINEPGVEYMHHFHIFYSWRGWPWSLMWNNSFVIMKHWDLNKMADFLQKKCSKYFLRWKKVIFGFKFHWHLFLRIKLTILA